MEQKHVQEAIKQARENSKKRNFSQTFDLVVSLKDFDLSKPENKVKEEVVLPAGRGKPVRIGAIAEGELAENAKKSGIEIIVSKADLQKLQDDKKSAKKLVNQVDVFIASPDLMAEVGKTLGPLLGPRDKMPKPLPPTAPLEAFIQRTNKVVNVRTRDQPIIQCLVGTEVMKDEEICQNLMAVLTVLENKLPKGLGNIKAAYVKLTMGKPALIGGSKIKADSGGGKE